jgi:hypothetical protein
MYSNLTNFIFFSFDYTINFFKVEILKKQIFGEKTKFIKDSVNLLYKSGGTTRCLLNYFFELNKDKLNDCDIEACVDAKKTIEDTMKNYKLGDWDYQCNINYIELKDKGYNNDELLKLVNYLEKTLLICLTFIKKKLKVFVTSEKFMDKAASIYYDTYFVNNATVLEKIENYIKEYNIIYPLNTIQNINIDHIYITGYKISKNGTELITDDEKKIIRKHSFVSNKNSKIIKKTIDSVDYVATDFIELDHFLKRNNLEEYFPFLPLHHDSIYISHTTNLDFIKGYLMSNFILFREKINSVIELTITRTDGTPKKILRNIGIEIIDMSIPTIHSNRQKFSDFFRENKKKFVPVKIIYRDISLETFIPSPYFMFADMCVMLFRGSVLGWTAAKYEKRIKRLFYITLPCLYMDNKF